MAKNLVIVESPAKAKTIEKFLGTDFQVESSYGHIADLPSKEIGVDVNDNFKPKYEVFMEEKVIEESKQGTSMVLENKQGNQKKLFIESYGCQMNFADSEVVASILANQGYNTTQVLEEADLVLVNTCSIRDKAEVTVRKRLQVYNAIKRDINPKMKVGVLGCMAERLKEKFLDEEKIVDMVVGPDAYKDIPKHGRQFVTY